MRLAVILSLFAIVRYVTGDIVCPSHASDDIFAVNITRLWFETASNVAVAGEPHPPKPPRPSPARPPPRTGDSPADDGLWSKCSNKGCSLTFAMHADDSAASSIFRPSRDTAKSQYQSPDDLAKWHWSTWPETKTGRGFKDMYLTWGIGWALDDLGINSYTTEEDGFNALHMIEHEDHSEDAPDLEEQVYSVDGKSRPMTGASYSFTLNYREGVIIALNRKSPKYAPTDDGRPPIPDDMLPELQAFSDVAWIKWKTITEQNNADITNIRYFFSVGIINVDTKEVILRATDQKDWVPNYFPGHIFEPTDAEFSALLGTPNLYGFAYFLIQHKEQLGNMFISKIQVFLASTAHSSPCILLHVSKPSSGANKESGNPRYSGEFAGRRRRESGVDVVRTHTIHW